MGIARRMWVVLVFTFLCGNACGSNAGMCQELKRILNTLNINPADGYSGTPLQTAVLKGNKEIVQLLLDNNADVNLMTSRYHRSILALAMPSDDPEILEILLDNNADINARDSHGDPVLHVATLLGSGIFFKLLLERGADINITGWDGRTALQIAERYGETDKVHMLQQQARTDCKKGK
ncbi:hypothetical protein ASPWEDRAFT_674259 [Aspergillus wentii DTO 134E9]|uniref:Uncharacterized protein n=1 Tax=Aspergillus wentii DTO 134E9 TaxID=1073089 RepID=A0A1L9R7T0_ASPWE|nr:uncharacterized protein ASPWEDRAFT_674259 [Aspergillus wentii DTO 134E9]OJJ30969.1 hypothetical protein ASPWEDRAFT_674259 [Aspergillus wentii DTO 134E9]